MKQIFFLTLLTLLIGASSCNRPRGSAGACFNLSKTPAKLNDTLYLLNCSVNYDKFMWSIPSYFYFNNVNKHIMFVPTAVGNLDINLLVYNQDSTSASVVTKTISVQ